MTTDADKAPYPNSAASGVAIPFSIGDPIGTFSVAFLSASASAQKELDDSAEDHILVMKANQDCVVRFGTSDPSVADDVWTDDQVYIYKGLLTTVLTRNTQFKVRGLSANGILRIQVFRSWESLETPVTQRNI